MVIVIIVIAKVMVIIIIKVMVILLLIILIILASSPPRLPAPEALPLSATLLPLSLKPHHCTSAPLQCADLHNLVPSCTYAFLKPDSAQHHCLVLSTRKFLALALISPQA